MKSRVFAPLPLRRVLPLACSLAPLSLSAQAGGPATETRRPNLILIMADQLRNDVLSCRGDAKAQTPHLDRFKRESADFVNTVSVSPVSAAYRASLFTGKYTSSTGMVINEIRMNPKHRALGHVLTEGGYNTAYIGKWHLYGTSGWHNQDEVSFTPPGPHRLGFDGEWKSYGFHHDNYGSFYYENEPQKIYYGPGKYEPEEQFNMAMASMERLQSEGKPFALFLSVGIPHDPWVKGNVPQEFYKLFKDTDFGLPETWSDVPDPYMDRETDPEYWLNHWKPRLPELQRVYYAMVSSLDTYVGRLMQKVSDLGLDEDTIIVFCSDHGEMFGEHGRIFKLTFYEAAARVPFMVRWKGHIPQGLEPDACLNTPDIMPTLLAMMGLPIPEEVEGMDLSPLALGRKGAEPPFAFMQGMGHTHQWKDGFEWRAVRDKRFTYARYLRDGSELLFDNLRDPLQTTNVIQERKYRRTAQKLRKAMDAKMAHLQDEFMPCTWYRDHWVKDRIIRAAARGEF